MSQVEKLKRMYDIKLTDDQKNLYQDICYGNNLIKSSDAVFPAQTKSFSRKGRLVKYIARQKEEMAGMLETIQEPVFDDKIIPANKAILILNSCQRSKYIKVF